MTLPIVLRLEAQAEFDDAFDWYEGRKAGLGVHFAKQVRKVFLRIATNPQLYPPVFRDIRLAVMPRFPYCVYYRPEAALIRILAVFHNRRDPAVWQGRA